MSCAAIRTLTGLGAVISSYIVCIDVCMYMHNEQVFNLKNGLTWAWLLTNKYFIAADMVLLPLIVTEVKMITPF